MNSAFNRRPGLVSRIAVIASTPQQFATALRSELERNRKVIESGVVKVD